MAIKTTNEDRMKILALIGDLGEMRFIKLAGETLSQLADDAAISGDDDGIHQRGYQIKQYCDELVEMIGSFKMVHDKNHPEACPGCGCMPGDGPTEGCNHGYGCGANRAHEKSKPKETRREKRRRIFFDKIRDLEKEMIGQGIIHPHQELNNFVAQFADDQIGSNASEFLVSKDAEIVINAGRMSVREWNNMGHELIELLQRDCNRKFGGVWVIQETTEQFIKLVPQK